MFLSKILLFVFFLNGYDWLWHRHGKGHALKGQIHHTMPLRMTYNLMHLEQHLDQCMESSFGYNIQLGLEAVHVAIPQAIYTSEKEVKYSLVNFVRLLPKFIKCILIYSDGRSFFKKGSLCLVK